ncbi:MAG: DUF3953 domain-containing protein [Haloarculaceae archaeon]
MSEYQPGVCNIGTEERRKRRTLGAVSALVAGGFSLFVLVTGRPEATLLWTFPLWAGAFVGFFQDRLGFCVGFGVMARYDLSGSGGEAGSVSEAEAVRRDRRRALEVLAFGLLAAALTTASVYGVGVVG